MCCCDFSWFCNQIYEGFVLKRDFLALMEAASFCYAFSADKRYSGQQE